MEAERYKLISQHTPQNPNGNMYMNNQILIDHRLKQQHLALMNLEKRMENVGDNLLKLRTRSILEMELEYRFYHSRLIRFLNFFGCWFMYDTNTRTVYPNLPMYESETIKPPALTRLLRWIGKKLKGDQKNV